MVSAPHSRRALKVQREDDRIAGVKPSDEIPSAAGFAAKRRSQRVQISMPVIVSVGAGIDNFRHFTQTILVSANGCLLKLEPLVQRGQNVYLVNPATNQEAAGRVAYIGDTGLLAKEVGIEFHEPAPRFWNINFPPEDWDPAKRKLPTQESAVVPKSPARSPTR
jgi:hypothetical protein